MGFIINRIYVENYKLFDSKEIKFSGNLLSVFDGPNGYGKTSTFDAIEFLITGTISRIYDSEVIAGTASYETVFLAKNPQKDVLIKGEFVDNQKKDIFTIGIRIRAALKGGKNNNPKTILDNAENYFLTNYDIPIESWGNYMLSKEKMYSIRKDKFGEQNLKQFTLFHYVRQEDRLSYFKQSEKSRNLTIESLMGIEKESTKQQNAEQVQKKISAKIKELEKQIGQKKNILDNRPESDSIKIKYIPLFDGKYPWDIENVTFQSGNDTLLNGYLKELNALKAYVKYRSLHKKYNAVTRWDQIPTEMRNITIQAWMLSMQVSCDARELEKKQMDLQYLEKQNSLFLDDKILEVSFAKLCEKLNIAQLGREFDQQSVLLKQIKESQTEMQSSISELTSLRKRMHSEAEKIEKLEICPYCGTSWNEKKELEQQYLNTENIIKKLLDTNGQQFEGKYREFSQKVKDNVYSVLCDEIEKMKSDRLLQVYCMFKNRENFVSCTSSCNKIMEIIGTGDLFEQNENFEEIINEVFAKIESTRNEISDEYLQDNKQFDFEGVTSRYFSESAIPEILTEENLELKKQYLHNLYLKSYEELTIQMQKLTEIKKHAEEMYTCMKEYSKALKNSINKYEKQIIDQIEIPFFVYTSRLLQSYQGGQGVLIKNDGKSIRFTAPGSEHDVLYTMSSGQLSAVLLAFSLAMNKIYAGEGITTIFIDDPIQCMDDINMISFVELLRREFSDSQIIVSTHEEQFSNYIRYKFKKYHIDTQAITLKDA